MRRMTAVAFVAALPMLMAPGGEVGEEDQGSSISAWVLGGTVSPPQGTSSCGPWIAAAEISPEAGVVDVGTVREGADGMIEILYYRDCDDRRQFIWVGQYSGEEIAEVAADRVRRLLPRPEVRFAPPADAMIVNFETWMAVQPVADVSATASIPGLSATVVARPVRIEWATGSTAQGDPAVIECALWGSTDNAADGCVWTPRFPSVEAVTGSDDYRYHGSVSVVWAISWSATDSSRGTLGELATSTPTSIAVREIQTIGDG